ncbi:hypothetical protein SJAG_05292 [Schizosaccharomyces japonicus yFS275]|uniref:Uncharacterized protein n=1 Tax=Schizosaccharomyces japonicus (strain yFS275 / FY16936) TaxID=402676 RepID=B6K3K5_SCHJY|nr:hypothetical protein SJAG_05292 [Schizosaccharomyces japonicus yFS275]EEB08062.1 hypothetical protein SJAG_05292 [Schizosaccharomyces japonicus yFS275]
MYRSRSIAAPLERNNSVSPENLETIVAHNFASECADAPWKLDEFKQLARQLANETENRKLRRKDALSLLHAFADEMRDSSLRTNRRSSSSNLHRRSRSCPSGSAFAPPETVSLRRRLPAVIKSYETKVHSTTSDTRCSFPAAATEEDFSSSSAPPVPRGTKSSTSKIHHHAEGSVKTKALGSLSRSFLHPSMPLSSASSTSLGPSLACVFGDQFREIHGRFQKHELRASRSFEKVVQDIDQLKVKSSSKPFLKRQKEKFESLHKQPQSTEPACVEEQQQQQEQQQQSKSATTQTAAINHLMPATTSASASLTRVSAVGAFLRTTIADQIPAAWRQTIRRHAYSLTAILLVPVAVIASVIKFCFSSSGETR